MKRTQTTLLTCGLLVAALAPVRAEPPRLPVPAFDQSSVGARGYFYVGGTYVGEPGKEIMQGQIYVEVVAPKDVRRPYPAGAHPWRRTDRDQLDGNAGRTEGLDRLFRRTDRKSVV